ncbi:MAG TPA: phosphoribosyltransferase family protein [Acidimicrobiia bacterium]|nr:phosphoribosyltransferase family protein [Acidimicrobiia bacterium]
MSHGSEILLDQATLTERVEELASRIAADHADGLVLVGVLKGALLFTADLARALGRRRPAPDTVIDFLAISRYAPNSGRVRLLRDVDVDVAGRPVVLVEDLVDTGLTSAYLLEHLRSLGPTRVELCTLLDRSERRIVPVEPRYVGETIPGDAFVLGYGLHVGERYRNLPMVVRADREVLEADPDACLDLYTHHLGAEPDTGSDPERRDAMVPTTSERLRR